MQVLAKIADINPTKGINGELNVITRGAKSIDLTPKLVCPKFSEKDLETDKLAYLNFYREFMNCVASLDNKALKLVVLKNHLSGFAFQVIKHLSVSEENYIVALELLSKEFLDERCIVTSIFSSLLNGRHFLEEESPGNRLLSYIVFDKLPTSFQTELVHKVNTNYPSLEQILDNCSDICKILEYCKGDSLNKGASYVGKKDKFRSSSLSKKPSRPSTLENFHVSAYKAKLVCCFCRGSDHESRACRKTPKYGDRLKRCKDLKLCIRCTSSFHQEDNCRFSKDPSTLCWDCKTPGHSAIMCPNAEKVVVKSNACLLENSNSLLPIVGLPVKLENTTIVLNCLLDTGSERSYLSRDKAKNFLELSTLPRQSFMIKTFIGCQERQLSLASLKMSLETPDVSVDFLVEDNLDLSFKTEGLGRIISDLQQKSVKLSADFSHLEGDVLKVHGIVGLDIIQHLGPLNLTQVGKGSAFESSLGLILFGDVTKFASNDITANNTSLNYNRIVKKHASTNLTHVYFALNPKSDHLDPWNGFEESFVDRGIEQMFKVESIGIMEDCCSDYDKRKIEEFRSSIEYKDDSYHVSLSWDFEKLKLVPSNHQVSLAVLDRVVDKLSRKNLYLEYCKVFLDQEREDVIERIYPSPEDFHRYIWIPHRPVIKNELQCTTKIRPVFNCSLRTGNKPSLNDCAYNGVNLYSDLLELLLKFRTDEFVLLADIRKAFLMIRLKEESDRNRFCFFLKVDDKLICFRYKTLIFGFVSSPFILNYIVKYHVEKHSSGPCQEMLLNNFYVDNLVKTYSSQYKLLDLYRQAVGVMSKGSFQLKTCCSNSSLISDRIRLDGNGSLHGGPVEKVLGYWYNPDSDEIGISKGDSTLVVSTKRNMLAVSASIFDPIGLVLPITVKGKIILSQVWQSNVSWDQKVSEELLSVWNNFQTSLKDIQSIGFRRNAVQTDLLAVLMFCDASNHAYGIVEYLYQKGKTHMFFAKAKVAPKAKRTLPTLELLAVYLGVKHLKILVKMFPFLFKEIIIAVDAQVVLSWLLSDTIHTKCQFTKNRLKDIKSSIKELNEFGYVVRFRYVNTRENPADLVTRGVTLSKFIKEKDFWMHGPSWLQVETLIWPEYKLECVSGKYNYLVNALTCIEKEDNMSIIDVTRFSSLSKLVNSMKYVLKFIAKLKGDNLSADFVSEAKTYLIKVSQDQYFSEEKSFLKNKKRDTIPSLVNKFNLFVDENGLLRCHGRIENTDYFSEEIKNPILLPKMSHLTGLIILNCHFQCKHLGIAATLEKVRCSGFWISKARQAVKSYLAGCMICKRYNALSFRYPKMTNLPKHRVNLVRPFLHTGIDFTGHLWVMDGVDVKKMYILLFTCFNVRAVHIELVSAMSTQDVVLAFLRFFNVYGVPSHIYSDNALSFSSGCEIVKEVLISDEFKGSTDTCDIKHCRIPMYSAWFGAVWERLIKTVKSCLFKVIGRKRLDYFQLLTVLSDIQKSINDRPLTYRCSDDDNLKLSPLAPFFLILREELCS